MKYIVTMVAGEFVDARSDNEEKPKAGIEKSTSHDFPCIWLEDEWRVQIVKAGKTRCDRNIIVEDLVHKRQRRFKYADGSLTLNAAMSLEQRVEFAKVDPAALMETRFGITKVIVGDPRENAAYSIGYRQHQQMMLAGMITSAHGEAVYVYNGWEIEGFTINRTAEVIEDYLEDSDIAFLPPETVEWRVDCTCYLDDHRDPVFEATLVIPEGYNVFLLTPQLDQVLEEIGFGRFDDCLKDAYDLLMDRIRETSEVH